MASQLNVSYELHLYLRLKSLRGPRNSKGFAPLAELETPGIQLAAKRQKEFSIEFDYIVCESSKQTQFNGSNLPVGNHSFVLCPLVVDVKSLLCELD